MDIVQWLQSLYSADALQLMVAKYGIPLLFFIIFAETGLLLGFFLPGDSLLITAGLVAAKVPDINIVHMNIALVLAAVLGDQVGYLIGKRAGHSVFTKDDSRFFKKKYALEAHDFYLQHGGKALVVAKFLPILRTFVPFIAGVAEMPYRRFVTFSFLGGLLWISSMLWLGHWVGREWGDEIMGKLHYLIVFIVGLSLLPLGIGLLKRYMSPKKVAVADAAVLGRERIIPSQNGKSVGSGERK